MYLQTLSCVYTCECAQLPQHLCKGQRTNSRVGFVISQDAEKEQKLWNEYI